jgi:integrase
VDVIAAATYGVGFDPLLDKSYRDTALGRPIVDYLAWKTTQGRAPRTVEDKERYLSSLALMFPAKTLEDLGSADLLHWAAAQPGPSRRHRASHVNDFFRWAIRWDLIVVNPMDKLGQFERAGQRVYDIFLAAEVEALSSLPLPDGPLMVALFDAGLRKGEARRLQGRHVIPEPMPGQLRVMGGKGGEDRLVPLTERLSQRLAELAFVEGIGQQQFFWYDRPGGGKIRRTQEVAERAFERWWRRCLGEAGVRYRNPHMARHTFATNWLRKGGRLETLSLVMGHASIRTTFDLYGHLDTRDIVADLRLIEAAD